MQAVFWSWGRLSLGIFSACQAVAEDLSVVALVPMQPVSSVIARVKSTFSVSPHSCFGAHSGDCHLYPSGSSTGAQSSGPCLPLRISSHFFLPTGVIDLLMVALGGAQHQGPYLLGARSLTASEHCPALCLCPLTCFLSGEACLPLCPAFPSWLGMGGLGQFRTRKGLQLYPS